MKKKITKLILGFIVIISFFVSAPETNAKNNNSINDTNIKDIVKIHNKSKEIEQIESMFSNKNNDGNALSGKRVDEIQKYFSNDNYVYTNGKTNDVITEPIKYLKKNVAKSTDTYIVFKIKTIPGVGKRTCYDFDDGNNCTLVSLYNVLVYYRDKKNCKKIPSDSSSLYSIIRKQAVHLGFTKKKGISVTKNNNLVRNVWRKGLKYKSGSGSNNYLWTFSDFIDRIDKNQPVMFSLASGVYYNHTITVYGYITYKNNRTGKKYTFFMLSDGWANTTRYLAANNTGASYVGCMTTVKKPK